MNIKEVAEITGLSAHTIRFYEKSGLFPKIHRSHSGVRQFTESDVNLIQFASSLRRSGLPLQDIAEFTKDGSITELKANRYSPESIQRRVTILESHREKLLEQRRELEMLTDAVDHLLRMHRALRRQLGDQ